MRRRELERQNPSFKRCLVRFRVKAGRVEAEAAVDPGMKGHEGYTRDISIFHLGW